MTAPSPPKRWKAVQWTESRQVLELLDWDERKIGSLPESVSGCYEHLRDNGEPRYRRHHVGHSIGAEVYEQPILAEGNDVVIEAGMVINIETPYYEFGVGAVHVENPFVVSESGPNVLLTNGSPREMVVL